ncbi:MAG: phage tail protein [Chryseobacterium sp.]|uniref:SIP domain-containing protein n=1 Tax=unclassified Empedobacter TaxID=2643773 RepID=UPI000DB2C6C5|nr:MULTISPECIES: SIP domain-containing protein [unclassified Empedobacter]PZU16640.1 MAG: phage tail protein [Chryseobacterium sp.]HTN68324.1 SIP domain-containing protein [Dysgonamonadaceae bacterium]
MGIVENLLKMILQEATIENKTKLSETVYQIRLKNESIKSADFMAGYFLRLGIGIENNDVTLKDKVRSYSVWDIDKFNGTMEIAIATHSNGIGAEWAEQCNAGDKVFFKWKKGNFIIDNSADSYLMIGDLSALSHLYIINRNLPKDKKVESILYSEKLNELFADIDGTKPFSFYEMPQNPYKEIIRKIKEIVPNMKGKKMVYIGGDSRICVALNQFFRKELQWETKQIKTKPFWNPEKKGLE